MVSTIGIRTHPKPQTPPDCVELFPPAVVNFILMEKGKFLAEHYRSVLGVDAQSAYCDRKGEWYHVPKRFPAVFFDYYGCVLFTVQAEFDACVDRMKFYMEGARGEKALGILGKLSSVPKYRRLTPPPGTV